MCVCTYVWCNMYHIRKVLQAPHFSGACVRVCVYVCVCVCVRERGGDRESARARRRVCVHGMP